MMQHRGNRKSPISRSEGSHTSGSVILDRLKSSKRELEKLERSQPLVPWENQHCAHSDHEPDATSICAQDEWKFTNFCRRYAIREEDKSDAQEALMKLRIFREKARKNPVMMIHDYSCISPPDDAEYPFPELTPLAEPFPPENTRESVLSEVLEIHLRHPYVIPPKSATSGSAGLDLFLTTPETIYGGMNKISLPLGIKIPPNTVGLIRERSSAAMRNIVTHAGVIDADFDPSNDIQLILENKDIFPIEIKRKQAVAQLIVLRLAVIEREIHIDSNLNKGKRGLTRGFGSTGNVPKAQIFSDSRMVKEDIRNSREPTKKRSEDLARYKTSKPGNKEKEKAHEVNFERNNSWDRQFSRFFSPKASTSNTPKAPTPAPRNKNKEWKNKGKYAKNSAKGKSAKSKSLYDRLG